MSNTMDRKEIIMNFSVPPSTEDISVIASTTLDSLPEEILEFCDGLAINIEEIPDESLEEDLDLDDPFDLIALYQNGSQLSPGVESKTANDDDVITIFRRPLLDMWCETGDDLNNLVRQIMIEELGQNFDFSDEEIEEMSKRHHQGML
jgi:predicted Zn-dependent protease with MMP-like domain